jgi:plasmid stabilization system protein ParE
MAQITWTMKAADEYGAAIEYVAQDAPVAAKRLAQRIMQRIRTLRKRLRSVPSFLKMKRSAIVN